MDALTFQAEAMRLEKLMYHVSYSILRNNDDCADAVQEALLRAWQKRKTLRSMDKFKPWLMRILINQCNDMLRRQRKRSFFPLQEEAATVDPPQPPQLLDEALAALKPEWRLVIVLYYLEGYSVAEMAETLGVPHGTVKSRMKYARDRLGGLLREAWEEGMA